MLSLLRRIFRKYSKMMPLTPFFRRFRYIPYSVYTKMPRISGASQAVEKPLSLIKKGCRTLLALLVLHRAKLLASNQSVLALGLPPPYRSSAICATASCSGFVWLTASILAWTRGGSPSNIAPFPGKGFGDRD